MCNMLQDVSHTHSHVFLTFPVHSFCFIFLHHPSFSPHSQLHVELYSVCLRGTQYLHQLLAWNPSAEETGEQPTNQNNQPTQTKQKGFSHLGCSLLRKEVFSSFLPFPLSLSLCKKKIQLPHNNGDINFVSNWAMLWWYLVWEQISIKSEGDHF